MGELPAPEVNADMADIFLKCEKEQITSFKLFSWHDRSEKRHASRYAGKREVEGFGIKVLHKA